MKISNLLIIAICSAFTLLLISCSKDAEMVNNQKQIALEASQNTYYLPNAIWDLDCVNVGIYECVAEESVDELLPDYFLTIESAIDFVENTVPSFAVLGYSKTKKGAIILDLSYAGSEYRDRPGDVIEIYEEGIQLPAGLAEALGSSSITLLSGEYEIQDRDGSSFSGHVIVDAKIK